MFLRRDIPPVEEAPEIHNTLTGLWATRQTASFDLVQALNEGDVTRFEKLEDKMKHESY